MRKVTNQPKHYFRKFVKNYERYFEGNLYTEEEKKSVKRVVHSLNHMASTNSKKLTMKNLMKLLIPGAIISEQAAKKNRMVFH